MREPTDGHGTVNIKRVYEAPAADDGARILVDRIWPRGLTKEKAAVDEWMKDLSPSTALRKWYGHDPDRWPEFRDRYLAELREPRPEALERLKARIAGGQRVTLLFSSRERTLNNAAALKEFIESGAI